MVIQFIFLLLFLGFFAFFVVQAYNMVFRGYAPFLATKQTIIKRVLDELNLKEDSVLYELGAGRAGFLRAVHKKYPTAKLVGVEYAWLPYFLGQMQNAIANSNIKIIKKNIFKVGLHEADVVYCYLNVDTMHRLKEVFRKECKPGARVISYQFPLRDKPADKIIEFEGRKDKVFVYNY